MRVRLAHLLEQGVSFAVFDADARTRTNRDRNELLEALVLGARAAGLRVDKAALAFVSGGRLQFFGTPDLVSFLARLGYLPAWTHTINV
jgi:hypothetical protein